MPYKDKAKQQAYDRERRIALRAAGIKRDAAYAAAHREEIRERARRWRVANTARSRAAVKAYQLAHPDKAKRWQKEWRDRNPDRVRQRVRLWTQKDRQSNPEKYRETTARRRARKRATQVEPIDFKQILKDSSGLCGICRKPLDLFGVHFDHIVPLARGGSHTAANIQVSHARCNLSKGAD